MAIGTTVKVGFDAKSVKTGMASIKGMFSTLTSGVKGAFGGIKNGLTSLTALGAGLAVALGAKKLADWSSELVDMSMQTGVAIDKLVVMEEAFRLAGVPISDTSKVLSRFASSLYEAQTEIGPAREALAKLGLKARDMKGMALDDAFKLVGNAVAGAGSEMQGLENIMEDLFGARMGYGLLRLFKDKGGFDAAVKSAGTLGTEIAKDAREIESMADAVGGIGVQLRGLYLMAYRAFRTVFDPATVQRWIESFNMDRMLRFFAMLKNTFVFLREGGLQGMFSDMGDFFKDIGRKIGEGIKESMGSMLASPLKGIGNIFSGGASKGDNSTAKLLNATQEQTGLLRIISNRQGGWV